MNASADSSTHHSLQRGISDTFTIKDGELFLLMNKRGEIPLRKGHGLGLYLHDMRFLSGYTLRFANTAFEGLGVISEEGNHARFELGCPPMILPDGTELDKLQVGVECERSIDGQEMTVMDRVRLRNYTNRDLALPLTVSFDAQFRDMFQVRGLYPEEEGEHLQPEWKDANLVFGYRGLDEVRRQTRISFSREPARRADQSAEFDLAVPAHGTAELTLVIAVKEGGDEGHHTPRSPFLDRRSKLIRLSSTSFFVSRLVERSFADLRLLLNRREQHDYYAAGIPWFAVVFGRDSLLSSMMTLPFDSRVAESTLRLLASLQGRRVNDDNEEEPGRILHELRVGELARSGRLKKSPDYGTVDATPIFLLLFRELARWSGKIELFLELKEAVTRALDWIDARMEKYDGWLAYKSISEDSCNHQGWKDVDGGIPRKDGSAAKAPIALVEVQGLVYAAWMGCAELYRRAGDEDRARGLEEKARELRLRFNETFWVEEKGFLAVALEKENRPCDVVASNMGQALWTGIVDPVKSESVADHLLDGNNFSGWGVRTLSSGEKAYCPIGYHSGSVWPHDNALIAAGLKRYGHHHHADTVIDSMIQAAFHFPLLRLPELFCGFPRESHSVPVPYPTACAPQAWSAAAIPCMLATALGLEADAFEGRLTLRKPCLPATVPDLKVHGLRVGEAAVDLSFYRASDGHTRVNVDKVEGDCEVVVDLHYGASVEV